MCILKIHQIRADNIRSFTDSFVCRFLQILASSCKFFASSCKFFASSCKFLQKSHKYQIVLSSCFYFLPYSSRVMTCIYTFFRVLHESCSHCRLTTNFCSISMQRHRHKLSLKLSQVLAFTLLRRQKKGVGKLKYFSLFAMRVMDMRGIRNIRYIHN